APGRYFVSAQCYKEVFQPRPLSPGPDPLPARAYPRQWYPLALDQKSAQAVELTAGAEKSGVDFRMTPAPVTQVRGVIAPGSEAWHGTLYLLLLPIDNVAQSFAFVDPVKKTFEFRSVFPGSYGVLASIASGDNNRIGGWQRIEVGNRPLSLELEL